MTDRNTTRSHLSQIFKSASKHHYDPAKTSSLFSSQSRTNSNPSTGDEMDNEGSYARPLKHFYSKDEMDEHTNRTFAHLNVLGDHMLPDYPLYTDNGVLSDEDSPTGATVRPEVDTGANLKSVLVSNMTSGIKEDNYLSRKEEPLLYSDTYKKPKYQEDIYDNEEIQPYSWGFPNLGNTCYMNSVLQCVANTKGLANYFIEGKHLIGKPDCPLTEGLADVLASSFSKEMSSNEMVTPLSQFKKMLEKVAPIFEGYSQNDAHEFFRLLIEKVHDELNDAPKKSEPYSEFKPSKNVRTLHQLAEEWKRYSKERDNSLITRIFGGILLNEVICDNCENVSYTFEDALDLSLNLAKDNESSSIPNSIHSLYSCLREFTTPEPVEGYTCEKCKKKDTSKKRTTIWKQPEILVVHFKRFVYDMYGDRSALKDKVSFPLDDLSLDAFFHENSNEKSETYQLYGIVSHMGDLNFGHYIGYVYNEYSQEWLEYNDDHISKIEDRDMARIAQGSSEPYILFYKRV